MLENGGGVLIMQNMVNSMFYTEKSIDDSHCSFSDPGIDKSMM